MPTLTNTIPIYILPDAVNKPLCYTPQILLAAAHSFAYHSSTKIVIPDVCDRGAASLFRLALETVMVTQKMIDTGRLFIEALASVPCAHSGSVFCHHRISLT
jgi:hypothetical protein